MPSALPAQAALTKLHHKYHSANNCFGVGDVHTDMFRCRHHGNPVEAEVPLVGSAVAVQAMQFARTCVSYVDAAHARLSAYLTI
jgi:hypothetical protein